jgi:hypothetical protein
VPWFRREPSPAEVRAFARNRRGSAKAAEAYAKQQRDREATRRALADRRRAGRRSR